MFYNIADIEVERERVALAAVEVSVLEFDLRTTKAYCTRAP